VVPDVLFANKSLKCKSLYSKFQIGQLLLAGRLTGPPSPGGAGDGLGEPILPASRLAVFRSRSERLLGLNVLKGSLDECLGSPPWNLAEMS
jgi:hypothetical protein